MLPSKRSFSATRRSWTDRRNIVSFAIHAPTTPLRFWEQLSNSRGQCCGTEQNVAPSVTPSHWSLRIQFRNKSRAPYTIYSGISYLTSVEGRGEKVYRIYDILGEESISYIRYTQPAAGEIFWNRIYYLDDFLWNFIDFELNLVIWIVLWDAISSKFSPAALLWSTALVNPQNIMQNAIFIYF